MRRLYLALLLLLPAPAIAQDIDPVRVEKRVGKLESEMRAVQRKVFPGGDPKFFEPEISAPQAALPAMIGTPASAPLTDLTERVGELERQLRTLTGQVEANQFKLRQIEEFQTRMKGDIEFRLGALEGNTAAVPETSGTLVPPLLPDVNPPRPETVVKSPAIKPAAIAEVAWKAAYANAATRNWPATETAMRDFLMAWPKSPRISDARYWLGRSHAARDQNAEAARAYLELYKSAPRSDRAPDSLIGLAGAMNGLKKPKDACRVLGELGSVYGPKLTPSQQAEAKALRARAKCEA